MSFMWLFSSFFTMLVPTMCKWDRSLAVRSNMASKTSSINSICRDR